MCLPNPQRNVFPQPAWVEMDELEMLPIECEFDKKVLMAGTFFQRLFVDGIQLVTKLRNNMRGALMSLSDRPLLRKRTIIETVNDELKNIAQMEHSRHRSLDNFIVNTFGAIAAYCMFPKKPCIRAQRTLDKQPALF